MLFCHVSVYNPKKNCIFASADREKQCLQIIEKVHFALFCMCESGQSVESLSLPIGSPVPPRKIGLLWMAPLSCIVQISVPEP